MRVTRTSLLKNAQEFVSERVRKNRQILAVYLCGSLLSDEPLLGGATDIDLFFVHLEEPPVRREILRLTDEVHLDIAHLDQAEYRHARQLRVHPWLGPALNDSRVLYDPQHFMDFTIASVRGQFNRADHVHQRASQLMEHGRYMWAELRDGQASSSPANILRYFRGVSHTANAIVSLNGPPLTERRFLSTFPNHADSLGKSGLYPGLLGLLGGSWFDPGLLAAWIGDWQSAYQALSVNSGGLAQQVPARLHPLRLSYYRYAFTAGQNSTQPEKVLWPLLYTWTSVIDLLGENSSHYQSWFTALSQLRLIEAGFNERIAALGAYLEMVDDTLADWAEHNGVE